MREKIAVIMKGITPNEDEYHRIVEFPDLITPQNLEETSVGRSSTVSEKEHKMLSDIRNLAKQNFRSWHKDQGITDTDVEMADADANDRQSQSAANSPPRDGNPDDRPNKSVKESHGVHETGVPDDEEMEDDIEDHESTVMVGSEDEDSEDDEDGVDDLMGPMDDDAPSDGQGDED